MQGINRGPAVDSHVGHHINVDAHSSGRYIVERKCPEEMFDTIVEFDCRRKCFYVYPLGHERVFQVRLGEMICSCHRGGLCKHLLSVLRMTGLDDKKIIDKTLKSKSKLTTSALKRKTSKSNISSLTADFDKILQI